MRREGVSAAGLATALYRSVCEKNIIENTRCHWDDLDNSMWASLLPEEKTPAAESPNDDRTSGRKQP